MKKLVIWDLDGTLIDTSRGIFNSVRYTEKKLGLNPIPDEQLRDWIGPKIIESYLTHYDLSKDQAELAVSTHREYGITHAIYESEVYPGIFEVLEFFSNAGIIQAVATMKPQQMAEKILNHFNLQKYLVEIVGMDDNNNRSKADNIQTILSSFSFTDEDVVMIGDTMHDLNGAKKMDILFVPVSYGYGFSKDKPILVNGKEVYPIDKPNMLSSLIVENKI